jgi:hypothetical protein
MLVESEQKIILKDKRAQLVIELLIIAPINTISDRNLSQKQRFFCAQLSS